MARWSKALFLRLAGMALALGGGVLMTHAIIPARRRLLAQVAVSSECGWLSVTAERALMREGREGLDALFQEAQRCWELPDVRRAKRARVGLTQWDFACWLVPYEDTSCLILTDRLDTYGYLDGLEGGLIRLEPGSAGVPVRVDPVDFAGELLDLVKLVEKAWIEDKKVVLWGFDADEGQPVDLWNTFWTVHCAWQRGELPPRLAEWFRVNSLGPSPFVQPSLGGSWTHGSGESSFIRKVREDVSRVLYFNAMEKLQDTRWEELPPELDRIIRVFPRTRVAEEARLLKEGVQSIVREERKLDLTKGMDELSPEEARRFAAYTVREYVSAFDIHGSAAWRISVLETLACREGRPSPFEKRKEARCLPWSSLDAALPLLRPLTHDRRPTRSGWPVGESWYRYYTVNRVAYSVAYELAEAEVEPPPDSDHDGVEDWFELLYMGTLDEDLSDDHDGDGLTNQEELEWGGIVLRDTDGDGFTDKEEVEAGTRCDDRFHRPKKDPWWRWIFPSSWERDRRAATWEPTWDRTLEQ